MRKNYVKLDECFEARMKILIILREILINFHIGYIKILKIIFKLL